MKYITKLDESVTKTMHIVETSGSVKTNIKVLETTNGNEHTYEVKFEKCTVKVNDNFDVYCFNYVPLTQIVLAVEIIKLIKEQD